ncbi:MAG: hypothetical protein B0D92_06485 [Spirochaeta sp. LUC14_002_19_P3]|nr:MAG: hypothetical protein B0D92_06485 [Spirochaeta sp. LUC14_002_19_P3]
MELGKKCVKYMKSFNFSLKSTYSLFLVIVPERNSRDNECMKMIGVWSLRHPVPAGVIICAGMLAGVLALFTMNREFIPVINEPSAVVVSIWPEAAAEQVERELTSVLEGYFAVLSGLTDIRSVSREGVSIIRLRFNEDMDIDAAVQEVRTLADAAFLDLPEGILGKPVVSIAGSRELPVLTFAVSGAMDADDLLSVVEDDLVPLLTGVNGVGRVRVFGGRRELMGVSLDTAALKAAGVAPLDVLGALSARGGSVPVGLTDWQGGRWTFRVSGELTRLEDVENLVIGSRGGAPLLLKDAAVIAPVYADDTERIRSAGRDFLVVQVAKREEGHTLRISSKVREKLAEFDAADMDFLVLHDDADTVRHSLLTVLLSALTGTAMAVGLVWLFLRDWHYTSVIVLSLPLSAVITFAGMRLAGLSINLLTMAGLTVSLGMIVDAAIVVMENIHRQIDRGLSPDEAALTGTGGVAGAVTASAATSICVFLPMLFLKGIIGGVLKDISFTIAFALSASLLCAFIAVPPLARFSLRRSYALSRPFRVSRAMLKLEGLYRRGVEWSLRRAKTVLLAALAVLGLTVYALAFLGISFIPAADYNELFIALRLPPGTSLEESARTADNAEQLIRRELEEVKDVIFYVGMENDLAGDARIREAVWGQIILSDAGERERDFRAIMAHLNALLPPALPGVSVQVLNGGFDRLIFLGTDGPGYRVELSSESWEDLRAAAGRLIDILESDEEIVSTDTDMDEDRLFVIARLDGDALNLHNVDAAQAALTARIAYGGVEAGVLRPPGGKDRTIFLYSDLKNSAVDAKSTGRLMVRSRGGVLLSFDTLSDISAEQGLASIFRHNRKRTVTVVGYSVSENIRGIDTRLRKSLNEHPLPPSVEWRVAGIGELIADSVSRLVLALLVSLFLVYGVMALQFERLRQPLIIMAVVPFCLIGVIAALKGFGSDASLISFLGIAALGGIVVNNAIVLIDRVNQLMEEGMNRDEAIAEGAVSRLRPILMTTLTTFFGVLPLSLAQGTGARIYAPLGQAIAGGLITSTLITLFLVPVLYRLTEREERLRGAKGL